MWGNPFALALIKPQADCYFRLGLTRGSPEESYENDQQSRKLPVCTLFQLVEDLFYYSYFCSGFLCISSTSLKSFFHVGVIISCNWVSHCIFFSNQKDVASGRLQMTLLGSLSFEVFWSLKCGHENWLQ